MLLEPLERFFQEFGFDSSEIKDLVIGEKYVAVCLRGGQIGVCARLGTIIHENLQLVQQPRLNVPAHRILYNAYLNARFNYSNTYQETRDIFDEIDFSLCKKIVMVGYFKPVARKFQEAGIELSIFDKVQHVEVLLPYSHMEKYLNGAQHVILTATSVFNQSFMNVLSMTGPGVKVYLLGPSSILHPIMFTYPGIKKIYGAVFENFDKRMLELIEQGHGTRSFLPHGRKVYL